MSLKNSEVKNPRNSEPFHVAAFDIAALNLAIRGERIDENGVHPLIFEVISMQSKKVDREFITKLADYLDLRDWSIYNLVLLEGQLAYMGRFGRGGSPTNAKIQQFLEAYFLLKYRQIQVEIVPAKSKYPEGIRGKGTIPESPQFPEKMWGKEASDARRKTWSIWRITQIFDQREDEASLKVLAKAKKRKQKTDDLTDCCLLVFSYFQNHKIKLPYKLETP